MFKSFQKLTTLSVSYFFLVLALGCLLAPSAAFAQDQVIVEAEIDRSVLTTDERIVLTVTIIGGQPDEPPALPPIPDVVIVDAGSATKIVSVQGVQVAAPAYRYTIQPLETGTYRIDPIQLSVNGQLYQTDPITFEVQQGSQPLADPASDDVGAPSELSGQDYYVQVEVDNLTPYVGQQIIYTARFFRSSFDLLSRNNPIVMPDFVGFWTTEAYQLPTPVQDINGRNYQVITNLQPVFPTTTGELVIEPAIVDLNGQNLPSDAVVLNVRALPEPVPEQFSGAVGDIAITASIDLTTIEVGKSVMLRTEISGIGNVDTWPEPVWPELDGWRSFENQSTLNKEFAGNLMQGSRVYERFFTPSEPGDVTLPPIEYIYFNPSTETFETSTTEAFELVVIGSIDSADEVTTLTEAESNAIALQAQKLTPNRLVRNSWRFTNSWLFWLLWLVPAILVVGDKLLRVRESRMGEIEEGRKRINAMRLAQQALKAARIDKAQRADEAAERILTTYLDDKYSQSFSGMSQVTRAESLRTHNVRESRIRWINRIYDQIQQTRYGFDAPERGKLLDEVDQVIRQFERADDEGGK
ncbi:MAG: BatD family protein [Candidatus Promineifilaceae bacterium]